MRRWMLLPAAAALVLAVSAAPAPAVDSVDQARARANAAKAEADRAQAEYDKLAADANRVTRDLASGLTKIDEVDDAIARSEREVNFALAEEARLRDAVRGRALRMYITGGGTSVSTSTLDLDGARRAKFASVVNGRDEQTTKQWIAARERLSREKDELQRQRADLEKTRAQLQQRDAAIQAKLASANEAKQRAQAARDRQLTALKDAEAQATAARRADVVREVQRQRAAVPVGNGRTSSGGGGAIGGLRCPIAGPVSFTNDWGEPRSGGRTHAGTDLFSPYGTPNVAVIGGSVFRQSESVGGLSVYLNGDDGNTYYYTHLSGYAGSVGRVSAGDVVGYTGNSGNASGGVTHTHFEIRRGGPNGTKVNPYPTLATIC